MHHPRQERGRGNGEVRVLHVVRVGRVVVPLPDGVLLLIEVADTTLAYDRNTKLELYAKAGVVEVWIVNVQSKCVEVYRQPTISGYLRKLESGLGDSISPLTLPMVELQVANIFA